MCHRRELARAMLVVAVGLLLASCAPAAAPAPTVKAAAPASAAPPAAAATTVSVATTAPATPKPAAPAATPKPTADQPRYGGILTVGNGGDPPTFDVHVDQSMYSWAITSGTHSGLVKYDNAAWPEFKVVGDLATRWELSSDSKTYTFQLVKGARFHDGTPVTAEDAKFSFDRIRDPKVGLTNSPRRQQLTNVTSIDAPDDSTLRITLGFPQASFIPTIGTFHFAAVPKHLVLSRQDDKMKMVAGSGPFKFKDYSVGVAWELAKNADYFIKGRPYLDGIKGYIIKDNFTRFAALRTRSILFWSPMPYLSVSQAKTIQETLSDKIAFKWELLPAWYGVFFNTTRPPWNDVRLRQAMTMAFDRKKMLEVGLEGAGRTAMAAMPPGEWSLPEEEMMKVPGYAKADLDVARKLIAEAGHTSGFKADALVRTEPVQQAIALLVKDAVAPLGITVNLNISETAVYADRRQRKAFDIMPSSIGAALPDPDIVLGDSYLGDSGLNFTGYSNPQFDELYTKQSRALDTAERRKIVWEMQRILLKDVATALVYWANTPYAWWRDVKGFNPPSIGHRHSFMYQEMWLAK